MLENILVSGLLSGSIYALLAVGFSLIFGVARFPNFAHTAFFMVAAFLLYIGDSLLKLSPLLFFPVSILVPMLLAAVYYISVIDRVKQHQMAVMILAMALAMVLQELLLIFMGARPFGYVPAYAGYIDIGSVRISYQYVIAIVASVITTVGVIVFVGKTKFGYVIRAVSQDQEAATLMGIDIGKIYLIVMLLSAGLAA
ncbi:MAG: branched-chain amino acid ABC transporter permease, partial [Dehalococcoidia bacterium]